MPPDDDHPSPLIFLWIALFIMFVGFVWAGISYCVGGSEKAGQFGDAFGVINALFSSLAAAGAVYAVILQRAELREARITAEESAKAQADLVKLQACTAIFNDRVAHRDKSDKEFRDLVRRFHRRAAEDPAWEIGVLSERIEMEEELNSLAKEWKDASDEADKFREAIKGFAFVLLPSKNPT